MTLIEKALIGSTLSLIIALVGCTPAKIVKSEDIQIDVGDYYLQQISTLQTRPRLKLLHKGTLLSTSLKVPASCDSSVSTNKAKGAKLKGKKQLTEDMQVTYHISEEVEQKFWMDVCW